MTKFQRSYSRVWWANDTKTESELPKHSYYYGIESSSRKLSNIAETISPYQSTNIRRSVRSHDSGFNDSDHSPNTSSSSHISTNNLDNESPTSDENQNYMSPTKNSSNSNITQSPNETIETPPTVIRKKRSIFCSPAIARRISFSAPSSPDIIESSKLNSSFRSLDSFASKSAKKTETNTSLDNSREKPSSLRRGKTISPSNNSSYRRKLNRRRLLDCVSQVSGSTSDVYTLASNSSGEHEAERNPEIYHHYESLIEIKESQNKQQDSSFTYNNETVTFGQGDDDLMSPVKENTIQAQKLPLPTYDELYPPNGCSTPKLLRSQKNASASQVSDHTESSITALNGASQYELNEGFQKFDSSECNLSLKPFMTWENCTYNEYTNPLLNGNAYSTQFWLDEIRTTYCNEISSMLQTKSVLYEAARSLKLNSAIASKLIRQIQSKAINIETEFDEIERIFESHAKLVKRLKQTECASHRCDDYGIEIADNKCKEKISIVMKALTSKVCQFMSKLNSKIIFQNLPGCSANKNDLKNFERNVKTVIDLSQDLRVACETKIDDIETIILLKDFHTLKQSVLKTIRKVFRRLMHIIVARIEDNNTHEMLLRANINMVITLPAESVYNSTERFSSLNDAFITSGIVRVLLLICLDSDKIDIRASSLRALATICSSAEMIRQFIEIGGLDVVTDILIDDKRNNIEFEAELREAVSLLTQVTAPWHYGDSGNMDDLLKLSIDRLATRLTDLIDDTECLQTLMLSIACLNNLSHKSSLTFYSLMDNRSVHRIIHACYRYQHRYDFIQSAIFFYVSLFSFCSIS